MGSFSGRVIPKTLKLAPAALSIGAQHTGSEHGNGTGIVCRKALYKNYILLILPVLSEAGVRMDNIHPQPQMVLLYSYGAFS